MGETAVTCTESVTTPKSSFEYYFRMARIFTWDGILEFLRVIGCRREGHCTSQRRLDGKTVVITGGNTGMGFVTARFLWCRGADVVFTVRDRLKGESAMEEMRKSTTPEDKTGSLQYVLLDLSSFESVRRCAQKLLSSLENIDILINNAAVMMPPFGLTEQGFELQFGTNYLGHFLFTLLLLPKIIKSAPARIVIVSSVAQGFYREFELDTMNDPNHYYGLHAYFRSKAALVMFTRELAKNLSGRGVNVYTLNPGYVSTKLYKYGNESLFPGFLFVKRYFLDLFVMKDVWAGAQSIIHCAICESTEEQTGLYYNECRPVQPNKVCLDDKVCKDLWNRSLDWVGLGQNFDIFSSQQQLEDDLTTISE